jgi:hypothetical protein
MKSVPFQDVTQRRGVIHYLWFGFLDFLRQIGCPETSVTNYHYTLSNIPEKHRSGWNSLHWSLVQVVLIIVINIDALQKPGILFLIWAAITAQGMVCYLVILSSLSVRIWCWHPLTLRHTQLINNVRYEVITALLLKKYSGMLCLFLKSNQHCRWS